LLGIPAVRDCSVQQVLADILTPIFDPHFHPSICGYRPGRNAHDAIEKATLFTCRYRRQHVVDMDLSKCFDRLAHELILKSVRQRVSDGSILKLIERFLKNGVIVSGQKGGNSTGQPAGLGEQSADCQHLPGSLRSGDEEAQSPYCQIHGRLILCSRRKAADHARLKYWNKSCSR